MNRLEADIEANASDYEKVSELMQRQEQTRHELDEAEERWMYLQEKLEYVEAANKP